MAEKLYRAITTPFNETGNMHMQNFKLSECQGEIISGYDALKRCGRLIAHKLVLIEDAAITRKRNPIFEAHMTSSREGFRNT